MPTANPTVTPAATAASSQDAQAPSRSPMNHPLWMHILQANPPAFSLSSTSGTSDKPVLPPTAPMDKVGTSMRMLLHDTQVQFEAFSERVVKLTDGVDSAKREISTMQKLFGREHETLLGEVVDLANRCQTQIQKSIGHPAQASRVDELAQKLSAVDGRLTALDTKVDMLHMLNQTQSQALQTLQDQQSQVLAALAPILPLLQSIPLHIDNAKYELKDVISTCERTMSTEVQSMLSTQMQRPPSIDSSVNSELPPSSLPVNVALSSSPSDRLLRKRQKIDASRAAGRGDIYPSPRASSSVSQLVSNDDTPNTKASTSGSLSCATDNVSAMNNNSYKSNTPSKSSEGPAYIPTSTTFESIPVSTSLAMAENRPLADATTNDCLIDLSRSSPESVQPPALSSACTRADSATPFESAARAPGRSPLRAMTAIPQASASSSDSLWSSDAAPAKAPPFASSGRVLPTKPFSLKDIRAHVSKGTKRFIPIDDEGDDNDQDMDA